MDTFIIIILSILLLSACAYIFFDKYGAGRRERANKDAESEIRMIAEIGEESGGIDESEKEMIKNVFEFNNKTAGEIATHRVDIAALPVDASRDEVVSAALSEKYSRIPVYEGNIDNIVGILYVKDIFHAILSGEGRETDITKLLRKPYFVPETKKTDELFEAMRKNKVHMAIVVDEYGGTSGLVTMEDLIEEIMGSILDEYDDEEKPEIETADNLSFKIDGSAPLDYVSEYFGIDLPVDHYDTIGGFLIGSLGRIPNEDEQPEIEFSGIVFKIGEMNDNRIVSVLASKKEINN